MINALNFIFIIILSIGLLPRAQAQSILEVEWYPPETEKSLAPDRSRVVISGRTFSGSQVQIDGDSVMILNGEATPPEPNQQFLRTSCKVYESPDIKSKVLGTFQKGSSIKTIGSEGGWLKVSLPKGTGFISRPCFVQMKEASTALSQRTRKIENQSARANFEGFFEIAIELPRGLAQIPIQVTSPTHTQKTFMLSVNVVVNANKVDDIKINTATSRAKPPAAGKKIRLWLGAGLTYQSDSQSTTGAQDLNFKTLQAPGVIARGGYWGDKWGLDLYFRDAPGKIEADAPLQVASDNYHWRTTEAKGLYQFDRGPSSRIGGLPSQWQLRFGANLQQIPFFDINNANLVSIQESKLVMATLGGGLLLGQEQNWTYEFALGLQYPLSASGPGASFSVSSPFGYEAQLGAAYKFAPNWRLGLFSYTQSLSYSYEFQNDSGATKTGKQNLLYTTFDLRLGYEF